VRSVTRRESEWDEQQRTHVLALGKWRALRCGGCGGHLPDTTDIEADDGYVSTAITCHACVARDIAAKSYAEDPHPSALLFATKRRG
jgi:hypothetical protein